MTEQNLYIINYNSLYEILEEIKENLPFKIIRFNNESDFTKENDLNIKNSLIIIKSNSKLLSNEKFSKKNYLDLKDFPLSINKLIEIINLQLIKIRFNQQSKVIIKSYELDLNSKHIHKNNVILKLTEKEIELILYLNEHRVKHNVLDLQKNIWGYSSEIETHTVETHIYRLRKKMSNKFSDENFILSHKSGYFIE